MKFIAEIDIMPIKEILDPQGKAVMLGLHNLEIDQVNDVRIGRHITLTLDTETQEQADQIVQTACQKLLANLIMEEFTYSIKAV
ncbi:phosphoribosylformylglycinamidine synthase subunit PurS [Dyadobacter tibetensis]|uniref:phosphoribosylformylglycinamidine synthase subunit PurS n=1 Tax=Dyadobacter tibetensis TaxID=1211851 RepID=UPI00046FBD7F|nr:phosphoribosylformylglycinamidine synthase subunit PurS [Dyadobacter tibetensis]